jgi:hypothetical protein
MVSRMKRWIALAAVIAAGVGTQLAVAAAKPSPAPPAPAPAALDVGSTHDGKDCPFKQQALAL